MGQLMALFETEKAKNQLLKAEQLRAYGMWPIAIGLTARYSGSESRMALVRPEADTNDWQIAAGAARIAHVSANSLGRVVEDHRRDTLLEELIYPLHEWFEKSPIHSKLTALHTKIHGGTIEWLGEHRQDMQATYLYFGPNEKRWELYLQSWKEIQPWIRSGVSGPEEAAAASSAAVQLMRLAKETHNFKLMEHGLKVAEKADKVTPNPERMKVLLAWMLTQQEDLRMEKPAAQTRLKLEERGASLSSLKARRMKENTIARLWKGVFSMVPMEVLTHPYK